MNLCKVTLKFTAHGYGHTGIPIHDNPLHLQAALGNLWFCFCSLRKHSVHVLNSPRSINLFWCRTVCAEKKGQNSCNRHTGCVLLLYVIRRYSIWFAFCVGVERGFNNFKKKKIINIFPLNKSTELVLFFLVLYISENRTTAN